MTAADPPSRGDLGTYRRGLHILAVVAACAVFPLIVVGAGVTSKDVGMAFPDGFTANGYFWGNPPGWFSAEDTRWEHGHRLLGRLVGILAIVLAIWGWRRGGTIRVLCLCNLLAIVTQGVLGAFRVSEVSTSLAMVHGIFGQLCFCLSACVALVTGRTWATTPRFAATSAVVFLHRLCLFTALGVLVQLVLGAAQRHFASGPALVAHIFWAIVVCFLIGWIAMWVIGQQAGGPLLRRLAQACGGLMVAQLLLGGSTFLVTTMGISSSPLLTWAVPSAHVATGALLLADLVLLTLCTYRMLPSRVDVDNRRRATALVTS